MTIRITSKQAQELGLETKNKRLKFNNKFTKVDGITFQSRKEAKRWGELKLLEKAGEISSLKRQQVFEIVVNGVHVTNYKSDFSYVDTRGFSKLVVEDVKGGDATKTDLYLAKKALMKAVHSIEIKEI